MQWKAATGRKKKRNYRKQQNGSSKFLPVITLYENGLNSPMRRHGVTEWILKDKKKNNNKNKAKNQLYAAHKKTHFSFIDTHSLKMKGWKKGILCK